MLSRPHGCAAEPGITTFPELFTPDGVIEVPFDGEGSFRRRYICVMTLRDGRIAHLREYGGPFIPVSG